MCDQTDCLWGLAGRVLRSARECTRDEEWRLLLLELANLEGGPRLSVLVEQTGGDALRLHAPVQWQGDEADWLAQQPFAGSLTPGLQLSFTCHSILVRVNGAS